jgi:RHS repeat-associated protein
MTGSAACASVLRFSRSGSTGKERDTESGNDYFGARYYASSMGRFMSPDWSAKVMPVPYAKLGNPQSLNLYAYMLNNPLKGTDPDGHDGDICKQNGANCNGKVQVTQNKDGTSTATMGVTKSTTNYDANGNPTSVTTTSTITTVKMDDHNNVMSATKDESVTDQKVDAKGNISGPEVTLSSTHGTVSQLSPDVAGMQKAASTWKQQDASHWLDKIPVVGSWLKDLSGGFTWQDVEDGMNRKNPLPDCDTLFCN